MSVDRCAGHCCRAFHLPYPPDQLLVKARAGCFTPDVTDWVLGGGPIPLAAWPEDLVMVCDYPTTVERWYTCSFLQPNGDCGIYDLRPSTCRDYPQYEHATRCAYQDCDWRLWKAGLPVRFHE